MLNDDEEARFAEMAQSFRAGSRQGSTRRVKMGLLVVLVGFVGLLGTFTWSLWLGVASCAVMYAGVVVAVRSWPRTVRSEPSPHHKVRR